MSGSVDFARRSFLRGKPAQTESFLTPPWSLPFDQFLELCTRCGECQKRCPENVIVTGSGGHPTLDFDHAECTLCGDCVDVCEPGALTQSIDPPWQQVAQIGAECLVNQSVVCRSCGESCEQDAITFRLALGGVAVPAINHDLCNGCGACVSSCPVKSISVDRLESI